MEKIKCCFRIASTSNHECMLMSKKRICLLCLLSFFMMTYDLLALDEWTTFKEEEAYSISYRRVHCDDIMNGVAFDFFAIRLENKSDKELNLQWFRSPEGGSDENYVSIILAPGEVMQGNCGSYANNHLMVLASARSASPYFTDFKFYLL